MLNYPKRPHLLTNGINIVGFDSVNSPRSQGMCSLKWVSFVNSGAEGENGREPSDAVPLKQKGAGS